jgi:hypothetical protein
LPSRLVTGGLCAQSTRIVRNIRRSGEVRANAYAHMRVCASTRRDRLLSEYPAEVDERIRLNEEEADAAERRWREQSLTR